MFFCNIVYTIIIMNLVDIKGTITSKQRLVLMISFLIVILVVFYFLRNVNKKVEGIDYKKTDINGLLALSQDDKDRYVYWNLNEIISKFLNSYQSEYTEGINDINYYYKTLDPNYKKYLGRRKYKELANSFIDKVVYDPEDDLKSLPQPLITKIKRLNDYNNAYLCKIATKNNEDAYIGIILDIENTRYNIFYIY